MTTQVPATLIALQNMATATITGVEVTVGPNIDPASDYLCIGWVDEHNPGVTVSSHTADAGMSQALQDYDIHHLIGVHRGEKKLSEAIADAYTYYDELTVALRLDHTLNGSVARAIMQHSNLTLSSTERGRMAVLRFAITVRTWK